MKLNELEQQLGVRFPEKFHAIYKTGAMKWLEMSNDEIKEQRADYINDSSAFLMLNCYCEPFLFEEIPDAIEELHEWIGWQERDRKIMLNPNITLIPFGHSGGGDQYCFLYTPQTVEPIIIQYYHDEYGDPIIEGHDFDAFLYHQMLEAVENEEDVDGENFRAQLQYLDEKYRILIEGKDADALRDDFYDLKTETVKIWGTDDAV